jgi:hypothetical protein
VSRDARFASRVFCSWLGIWEGRFDLLRRLGGGWTEGNGNRLEKNDLGNTHLTNITGTFLSFHGLYSLICFPREIISSFEVRFWDGGLFYRDGWEVITLKLLGFTTAAWTCGSVIASETGFEF